ncbi:GNAT family N-acetyltransferase [Rhodospirillaceae bacterium KN72]|uniref:GNAT family N-acetyltransferase n=2 Tax=Pacificispira spongiicola TaxID=2729598 RepID=A0A7Y0E2V0_9PROT|nr:GNAT family N-acetyltransferase [Pacificispira spongiicola]
MLWRLSKRQMEAGMGDGNRDAMRALFADGPGPDDIGPGLIARVDGQPAGWIQIDRRSAFPRLETSRVLKPVDDADVWSIACFLVDKRYRRQGLSAMLLRAACDHAARQGARIVEGYPIDTPNRKYAPVYAWTGFVGAFRDVGFTEVARRSDTRPIMRKVL